MEYNLDQTKTLTINLEDILHDYIVDERQIELFLTLLPTGNSDSESSLTELRNDLQREMGDVSLSGLRL